MSSTTASVPLLFVLVLLASRICRSAASIIQIKTTFLGNARGICCTNCWDVPLFPYDDVVVVVCGGVLGVGEYLPYMVGAGRMGVRGAL